MCVYPRYLYIFFFKQKTAYEIGLGIPAEPLFRSLDINNTIDHRPEGDEKWFLENEKTVTQFCRKLAAERPLKDIRDEYNYPKKKGIKDECSRLLEASAMKSRTGFAIQRLMHAMRQAHADGWFIVFDTLTLAEIGRASCRERVEVWVLVVATKI